jgi:HipA N-terminal domain
MAAFRSGSVRVGNLKAGRVRETESGYEFAYDPEYLAMPGVPPVSLTLPSRYPGLPEVEDATMRLAAAAGLRTVPHSMIRLKSGELAYITRRIDRAGR